jgi:hypothetical protein
MKEEELLKTFSPNIPDEDGGTEVACTDASELLESIIGYVSKVRTETILGHKYVTGFICKDGTEITLTDLL